MHALYARRLLPLTEPVPLTAPVPTDDPILKDGRLVTNLAGYNIRGNNYFKLRDLGMLFDFNVSWDAARNAVVINTSQSYDPTT